jgi:hypothetical protein
MSDGEGQMDLSAHSIGRDQPIYLRALIKLSNN